MHKQKTIAKWLAVILLMTVAVACYIGLSAIVGKNPDANANVAGANDDKTRVFRVAEKERNNKRRKRRARRRRGRRKGSRRLLFRKENRPRIPLAIQAVRRERERLLHSGFRRGNA